MSTTLKQSINGLVAAINEDSKNAQGTFEVTSTLLDGVKVRSEAREFEFLFDEPEGIGGKNTAANPVEYVLAALGACQAITYRAVATLKGIQLEGLKVKATGDLDLRGFLGLDLQVEPGFQNVHIETTLISDESPEKLDRLAKDVERLCPVLDILQRPIKVSTNVTLQNSEISPN